MAFNRLKKVMKQRKTGIGWGYFMQIIQQEAVVVQGIMIVLQMITTASVLQIVGYQIPLWLIAVMVGTVLIVGGVVVFIKGMPSYFKAFNQQFYKHENPMRKDIELLQENQKIEHRNNVKIMEHLGLEPEPLKEKK